MDLALEFFYSFFHPGLFVKRFFSFATLLPGNVSTVGTDCLITIINITGAVNPNQLWKYPRFSSILAGTLFCSLRSITR
jgi:hypothetical protein